MDRRHFIQRLGLSSGALLAGQLFDLSTRHVFAQSNGVKKRLLIYHTTEAIVHTYGSKALFGHRDAPPIPSNPTSFDWPRFLRPLESIRPKVTLAERFFNTAIEDLHGNKHALVTCEGPGGSDDDIPGGPSFESVMAPTLSAGMAYPVVHLGVSYRGGTAPDNVADLFASDRGKLAYCEGNPVAAFQQLFSAVATSSDGPATAVNTDASLLDYIRDDVRRVRTALASEERANLDEYLAAVEKMQQRAAAPPPVSNLDCSSLQAPDLDFPTPEGPSRNNPANAAAKTAIYMPSFEAQVEHVIQAFRCGLTNSVGLDGTAGRYTFLNGETCSHSHFWHGNAYQGLIEKGEAIRRIQEYHAGQIRRIYDALAQTPEGDGTMADGLLIVWVSKNGGAHHRGYHDIPVVLIGDAGGAIQSGRYVNVGTDERSMNDFWVTMSHALDAPLDRFGSVNRQSGPIADLLT